MSGKSAIFGTSGLGGDASRTPLGGLLVEADHVSCRIAEPGSDLRRIRSDRLHDLAAISNNGFNSRNGVIHHDVHHQPRIALRRPALDPSAAHFPDGVIKRDAAVTAFASVPAKHLFVKR
jgi:hypothetical protein